MLRWDKSHKPVHTRSPRYLELVGHARRDSRSKNFRCCTGALPKRACMHSASFQLAPKHHRHHQNTVSIKQEHDAVSIRMSILPSNPGTWSRWVSCNSSDAVSRHACSSSKINARLNSHDRKMTTFSALMPSTTSSFTISCCHYLPRNLS